MIDTTLRATKTGKVCARCHCKSVWKEAAGWYNCTNCGANNRPQPKPVPVVVRGEQAEQLVLFG